MSLSLLNADSQITIVQNNVDQLKNLTISSVTDLQNQLDLRYVKKRNKCFTRQKRKYIFCSIAINFFNN